MTELLTFRRKKNVQQKIVLSYSSFYSKYEKEEIKWCVKCI